MRIVADMAHIPLRDSSADVVFLLNTPIPISIIKRKAERMVPGSLTEVEDLRAIRHYLGNAMDATCRLNMLESLRVLKPGGTLVTGAKYTGQSKEGAEEAFGEFPLVVDKHYVVELDRGVLALWRAYGISLNKPTFAIATFKRTEGAVEPLVEQEMERLNRNLGKLVEIETFGKVMEKLRSEAREEKLEE